MATIRAQLARPSLAHLWSTCFSVLLLLGSVWALIESRWLPALVLLVATAVHDVLARRSRRTRVLS
jgi:hypothetical protein